VHVLLDYSPICNATLELEGTSWTKVVVDHRQRCIWNGYADVTNPWRQNTAKLGSGILAADTDDTYFSLGSGFGVSKPPTGYIDVLVDKTVKMAILSTPLQYLTSIPPVTRGFSFATIAASSLYLWIRWTSDTIYIPYLTLVPGSSFFYPWTFVSSALVEVTVIEVGLSRLPLHRMSNSLLAYFLVDRHPTMLTVFRASMGYH